MASLIAIALVEYKRDRLLEQLKIERKKTVELENNLSNELKLIQKMMNDFLKNYNRIINNG